MFAKSSMNEARSLMEERRKIDEEHALLRKKLENAERLLIQGTEKAVSIATMEEAVERLQRMVRVEQDGRRVAELQADEERKARHEAEAESRREVEARHAMEKRVNEAQQVATEAEERAKTKKERSVGEVEAQLEMDLAAARRELAEVRAERLAVRTSAEVTDATLGERREIAEDIVRAKTERRMKEENQLSLAKHEAEMSIALAKAAEEKVAALEAAAVQKRQALAQKDEEHAEDVRRVDERKSREVEAARDEMRIAQEEVKALTLARVTDKEVFAREKHEALAEAGAEYEATLRKLRDSHETELAGLKAAHDQLLETLRSEKGSEEGKLRNLVDSLSQDLKSAEEAIEAERTLRVAAERAARADLEARRVAEQERAREQMYRQMAEELVGETQRARDAAERRTKEQYLEVERVKHAAAKRRALNSTMHESASGAHAIAADVMGVSSPGGAAVDDAYIEQLPNALGLEPPTDAREALVVERRTNLNDCTAAYKAALADLKRAKDLGTTEPEKLAQLSKTSAKKRDELAAAAEAFSHALHELQLAKEKELTKIRDEHEAMTSALTKYSQSSAPVKAATKAIGAVSNMSPGSVSPPPPQPAGASHPPPGGGAKMKVGEPAAKAAAAKVIAGGGGGGGGAEEQPGSAMSESSYSDSDSDYTDATTDSRPNSANPVGAPVVMGK